MRSRFASSLAQSRTRLSAAGSLLALVLLLTQVDSPAPGQAPAQPPAGQAQGQPPRQAQGQPPPRQADQPTINSAIQRGVAFLQSVPSLDQTTGLVKWGVGTKPGSDGWLIGYTSLAGITLIECGVPNSDPAIQSAAKEVRYYIDANEVEFTYEAALAILFLDRMGDKKDRSRIQLLAGRLMAGQSQTGGWGYKIPKRSKDDLDRLMTAIRRLSPPQDKTGPSFRARPGTVGLCIKTGEDAAPRTAPPDFDLKKAKQAALATLPQGLKILPLFLELAQLSLDEPAGRDREGTNPTTDNSNTHFAMLGLWAARKYDVPADRSFTLLINRYRTSQGPDGSWDYKYKNGGNNGGPAMTCVALLGLAIGHVLNPDPAVRPEKDPLVIKAFTSLGGKIGEPAGRIDGRPDPNAAGGLYFLWGMERIAVLYDVHQLDKKDWYKWGAEILLGSQAADGSWSGKGGYPGDDNKSTLISNTCFALLFLKRANLTPDLSRRLTVDTSALTQTLTKPSPPEPTPAPKPEPTPVASDPPPPPKPTPTPKPKPEPTPIVAAAPVSQPAPPPAPKSKLPWIILIVFGMLAGGGCIAFVLLRNKKGDDEEEDEDRPRKKSKKTKIAALGEKAANSGKKPAKRLKAEVDDDEE